MEVVNSMVGNDKRFHIINNKTNLDSPTNYFKCSYDFMKDKDDNEILVELCGDDWFATPDVLSKLNDVYNSTDCWLTYGGMRVWNGGEDISTPDPQNTDYPELIHKNALYRRDVWRAGHLHSFRWFLHKQFDWQKDGISKFDSEIFKHAVDLQLQFSVMEMCPPDKIVNLAFPTVVFNNAPKRERPLKDGTYRDSEENIKYEIEVRNKKKYKRIYSKKELKGEKLPQVNTFGDYRERHTIPKDFSYVYNLPDGEYDLTILQDDNILNYLDGKIKVNSKKPIVAIVAEPPHLFNQKQVYSRIQKDYDKFSRVIGWHKDLEHLSNFKLRPGETEVSQWNLLPKELDTNQFKIYKKTKLVSFISSLKSMSPGHKYRLSCLESIRSRCNNVDFYGRDLNPIDSKLEGLKDYHFSVAIENGPFENYFTEKILDCMLAGTMPIYYGCPNIGDFFNTDGMIIFKDQEHLHSIITNLDVEFYNSRLEAIEDNFNRALELWLDNDIYFNRYLKDLI